ncbi:hypothetical protein Fuma_01828 [Fuerstiella marisgermanici]|uniref:Uncharacterized protein n=1 Tax=Fuerstiella marisgermanici TaxID=1891926 RepID=A0A1P8WDW1_9PLAN|nr:hypothetical protein Fuma_01828 [Fuerstiella marisgermanici]
MRRNYYQTPNNKPRPALPATPPANHTPITVATRDTRHSTNHGKAGANQFDSERSREQTSHTNHAHFEFASSIQPPRLPGCAALR